MRLTNIEIKNVTWYNINGYRVTYRNYRLLVLNTEDDKQINILLGIGCRWRSTDNCTLEPKVPIRYLHKVDIVITYDYLLREFLIVKHRFAADNTKFNSINGVNRLLLQQFLNMGFGRYDVHSIINKICECFNLTTDEPIFFTRSLPFGCTRHDLHINGENSTDATRCIGEGIDTITPIKINIKHIFSD